jgi:DNA-binding HxlR family transcriptional regulator
MNERLRKLVRFGILRRISYPEVPPRVEYQFTDFGKKFLALLDQIEQLETDLENELRG